MQDESILRKFIQMKDYIKKSKIMFTIFHYVYATVFTCWDVYDFRELFSIRKFGFTEQQILYVRALGIIGMLMSVFAGKISIS